MSTYDEIAEWYDAWVGPDSLHDDGFFQTVEALMGKVDGLSVCDLACGQGRVARALAERGASVVGVDISVRLLDIARRSETLQPRGVQYRQADARTLDGCADGEFDGVVCFMSLMDIAELEPTLRSVHRILLPGGWFVFAILHPCYNTARSGELMTCEGLVRTIGAYFDEGHWRSDSRTGPPGKVGAYHRTLSTYLNALLAAGFRLDFVGEPVASGKTAGLRPIWAEVPAVFAARFTRG